MASICLGLNVLSTTIITVDNDLWPQSFCCPVAYKCCIPDDYKQSYLVLLGGISVNENIPITGTVECFIMLTI